MTNTEKDEVTKKEFNESSFEEGYATARRIYEVVIVKTLNINNEMKKLIAWLNCLVGIHYSTHPYCAIGTDVCLRCKKHF